MRLVFAVGISMLATMGGAFAQDAANGKVLAQRWCSSCHIVGSAQVGGSADLPTFGSIARRPGFNARRLANFLADPHPKMPNMALSRGETADIAAYIATLQ
jgi:mono/diheme cytochrome c family protein